MRSKGKRVAVALGAATAVGIVGVVVAAGPAGAAAGMRCFDQGSDRLQLGEPTGTFDGSDVRTTTDIEVTPGSPCRDINVWGVTTIAGRSRVATLRVVWQDTGTTGPWVTVGKSWRVLISNADEGRIYRIEAQGRKPLRVRVRG